MSLSPSVPLNPKLANELAAHSCELRVRDTRLAAIALRQGGGAAQARLDMAQTRKLRFDGDLAGHGPPLCNALNQNLTRRSMLGSLAGRTAC